MSESLTKFRYVVSNKKDYEIMAVLLKSFFDREDSWPVEQYDEENYTIEFEEVEATEDEVVEMVETYLESVGNIEESEVRDYILKTNFTVEGTTRFDSGEQIGYIIEYIDGETYIRETDTYYFFGSFSFDSYEDFCDQTRSICKNPSELLSEEEFDSDCEYSVTYNSVYTDEQPEYGKKQLLSEYTKSGTAGDADLDLVNAILGIDRN